MSVIINKTAAFIILLIMTLFLVMTAAGGAEGENPEISFSAVMDGSLFRALEERFTLSFVQRNLWLSSKAKIESQICEKVVNGVYIGDDMLLGAEVLSSPSYTSNADAVNRFSAKNDSAVYFVAVPTSSGVYSEILPEYLTGKTEKQCIDSVYSKLNSGIRRIDAYNILKRLNENYIYFRSDSKWTSYGAYCVYRTVIQKLGFQPSAYDKYTIEHVTDNFRGNLWKKSQYMKSKPDILDIYNYNDGAELLSCTGTDNSHKVRRKELYNRDAVDTDDMYSLYLGEDMPLVQINTSVNNERKLLVIKDDFADCFIPFLIQHYSVIDIFSPECAEGKITDFVNIGDYEQILFLFGTDSLGSENIFSPLAD
ncbi:MAG: hypothetical protein IJ666_02790 [Ruminococcus sp.]|nr:hypothetical protein [Ruminococcus sp.]